MRFDALKEKLAALHVPDDEVLRRAGLTRLAKAYEAYPTALDGRKIFVLVSTGLRPQLASRLSEPQLAQKVLVLEERAAKWTRVWPTEETPKETTPAEKGEALGDVLKILDE